ncbi:MAG: InlB B-repeat-containing protein [Acholeplasmatales bacterium]|nr:InlB B-repeat-containing protein [Acholeplasmatales bacterium]
MKKKIIILIILLFLPLVLLSSCKKRTLYESGDFRYLIIKEDGEEMAAIIELSDSGDEKEVIIIPEYLDGYKVYGMYDRISSRQWGKIQSNPERKIIITHYIEYEDLSFSGNNVLFIGDGLNERSIKGAPEFYTYLPSNIEIDNSEYYLNNANVTYYVDGDIYWIDDYDNSLITFIPENPTKEGYTFDGWYKDSEYQNKWDFDVDIVPAKDIEYWDKYHYDNRKTYNYKETKLYAKFIND